MKTATELAREMPPGPELDALFFETCCGWVRCDKSDVVLVPHWIDDEGCVAFEPESVSTDANACEAWAMRWARENGFIWRIEQRGHRCRCEFWGTMKQRLPLPEYGTDWKHALVRACIAAAEQLNSKGE